jgi:glucoamylase
MNTAMHGAPGWPGIPARWTSSAKTGVGTALDAGSRVWFTLSHGIFNEIYYPRVDQACTRDLGLIVTDGQAYFSEEKRQTQSTVTTAAPGVPAYHLTNVSEDGRYRIEKEIVADPSRDAVLQHTRFVPLQGDLADYRLYALLAPHLGNQGAGNTAWVGAHKGVPMLFAERGGLALALACSTPWLRGSAGYAGVSDGWQDLQQHRQLTWLYDRAENGNVALTGEIDLVACGGVFTLALAFGVNPAEAGHRALSSLKQDFATTARHYVEEWQHWQRTLHPVPDPGSGTSDLYAVSAAVLRVHEDKNFAGAFIASLSIPWGFAKGDHDMGGYHLVWPRDLVEAAGGLLAAGSLPEAARVLQYFQATQEADGHWAQNMWIDSTPYWNGIQLDETALPILFLHLAQREGALAGSDWRALWPMVRRAASYIVRNGPVTQEDRWEEDAGYTAFTLGAEIAALLVAADLAELCGEPDLAPYLRETADAWNAAIERWTYVSGTELARQVGVAGYYMRIAPPGHTGTVIIKNRPPGESQEPAAAIISPDTLALVRFGLRAPDDPRITDTVKVIDALLKVDTPNGPAWHRYNDDGYGEHAGGAPFDGTGIGRIWPLLTGERAHYELAAGRRDTAVRLLAALESFANEGGLLPEQIWDSPDIPARELYCGRPSGSAMPLVWAHAEYVKLRRSLAEGRVFDMPRVAAARYLPTPPASPYALWRFNNKARTMPAGKILRVETRAAAVVHWSGDGWQTVQDTPTRDTGLGMYVADLPTTGLPAGATVTFTFRWPAADRWEGRNFEVQVRG